MKKLLLTLFAVCTFTLQAQTLVSTDYELNPYIDYTVFEPQKDTTYMCHFSENNTDVIKDRVTLMFRSKDAMMNTLKFIFNNDRKTGTTYLLDQTLFKNKIKYVKGGVYIYSGEKEMTQSVYIPEGNYNYYLSRIGIEYQTKRQERLNKERDDMYGH